MTADHQNTESFERSAEPRSDDAAQSVHRSIARETGFSLDAVEAMQGALAASGGRMAQFDHPEFGGVGQWMQGGMVMTSRGRDTVLEGRIDHLCDALDGAAVERSRAPARCATDGVRSPDADSPSRRQGEAPRMQEGSAMPGQRVAAASAGVDPFVALEKLADLHARGVVSDSEFAAKKTELLGRI